MIINLTKKTIVSRAPNFKISKVLRAGIVHKKVFLNSDCIVFQNCKMALNLSRLSNIEVIFADSSNRIYKIEEYSKPKIFLRSAKSFTILISPSGAIKESATTVDDMLDLSAEITADARKTLVKDKTELILGIPNTAIEAIKERQDENRSFWRNL